MKKKIFFIGTLIFAAFIMMACSNLLGDNNRKESAIELSLPYGKAPASRAAEDSKDAKEVYSFSVIFKHESGTEVEMQAKSGENLTYKNAPTGNYKITVKGSSESGKKAEGSAEAIVEDGKTTSVSITLKITNGQSENEDELIEINILSYTDELYRMVEYYVETHPDCGLKLNHHEESTSSGEYTPYLNKMLDGTSDEFVPDIYAAEAAFVLHYTKGSMGTYALPYKDLIPDVDEKIEAAELAQYVVDVGKNSSGELVGLAYQSTGGAFIYNRTVAKTVFGTDDPAEIEKQIGAKSGRWDKFWSAAETCKAKNVAIISGDGDLWHPVAYTADKGWIADGKLHIDEKREAFLDYAKKLTDEGYSNNTQDWTDGWYKDMAEAGDKKVLGFFGPAWLISYSLTDNAGDTAGDWAVCAPPVYFSWGGSWIEVNKALKNASEKKQQAIAKLLEWLTLDTTENGLLYNWANGTFTEDTKDTVSSAVVMKKANGKLDFLAGQNMFECYIPMNEQVNANSLTEYDDEIDRIWRDQARLYADGRISREQALINFICGVEAKLGISYDGKLDSTYFQTEHVKAEADPSGKGVRFTLTAKEGENWRRDSIRIRERESEIYIRIEDRVPTPGNSLVVYFPFTENGKGYTFDCDYDVSDDKETGHVYEQVYSLAKGTYASASVDLNALKGLAPVVDLENGFKVTLSKDIGSAVKASSNVKPYLDFGAFTNTTGEEGQYDWKEWLNSLFPYIDDAAVQKNGEGIQMLRINNETVQKLKKNPYFFVNMDIYFEVAGFTKDSSNFQRFGYDHGFLSDIYPADGLFDNISKNEHISVEPCPQGVKVTLNYREGDGDWSDFNRVICLTTDGSDGISFEAGPRREGYVDGDIHCGNGKPTAVESKIEYIYPFTENGKKYEFVLDGSTGEENGERPWLNEYVCCTAGGGVGELIDIDEWNKNASISDYDYTNRSFKVNADINKVFEKLMPAGTDVTPSGTYITQARMLVDVYPGTKENHREEKFDYASTPIYVAGNPESWLRSLSDLNSPFVVENKPANPDGSSAADDTDDVDQALRDYNDKFWVTMTVHYIQISDLPGIEFCLPWK